MNRNIITLLIFSVLFLALIGGFSTSQETSETAEMIKPCIKCHTCPNPTTANPCLPVCMRHAIEALLKNERAAINDIEEFIVINELENIYEPVNFSHKGHAEMSLMGGGCTACHHHTPPGKDHPACNNCHDPDANKEHLRIQSLKAAYHQQCLTCHVEWGGTRNCNVCHPIKGSEAAEAVIRGEKTFDFPRLEPVNHMTFKSKIAGVSDVLFDHEVHSDVYGLTCSECHQVASCNACHNPNTYSTKPVSKEPTHTSCGSCHSMDHCGKCHPGAGGEKNFDHAKTGMPLLKYHIKLDCRLCHKGTGHYQPLTTECTKCHSGWTMDNFSHSIIGLQLDEIHSYFECTDCHENRQFDKPVMCAHCHDETYKYPNKVPGVKEKSKY